LFGKNLDRAVLLHRLSVKEGKPYDPKADGFVFSSELVARESLNLDRCKTAEIVDRDRRLTIPGVKRGGEKFVW